MKTSFHFLIFKAYHAQRNKSRPPMDEYGLSPGQPKVLRYLSSHVNCKLKDIAIACDIQCATASKILKTLEENQMLVRQIDPSNKRAIQVSITEKGSIALDKWNKHCHEAEKLSLKDFTPQEWEQFKEYLSRMYKNLTDRTIE